MVRGVKEFYIKNKTKFDLIVVGRGFARESAAISASREGLDVLIVERYNSLGGASGNELVMPFMSYSTKDVESVTRKYL